MTGETGQDVHIKRGGEIKGGNGFILKNTQTFAGFYTEYFLFMIETRTPHYSHMIMERSE